MTDTIRGMTEFIFIAHDPLPSDIIFIPGSSSQEHVLRAADLYLQGYAPLVLPSGRYARNTGAFQGPPGYASEWEWMHDLLTGQGVPETAILREDRATFTWENALFSRDVLDMAGITVRSALLCCQPAHARRCLFYYESAFPSVRIRVCPPSVPGLNPEDWTTTAKGRALVLGEIRRMGDQILDVFERQFSDSTGRSS